MKLAQRLYYWLHVIGCHLNNSALRKRQKYENNQEPEFHQRDCCLKNINILIKTQINFKIIFIILSYNWLSQTMISYSLIFWNKFSNTDHTKVQNYFNFILIFETGSKNYCYMSSSFKAKPFLLFYIIKALSDRFIKLYL